ncbi:hypothetical protein LMIY3S_02330 [Labrys miyagiensis]
MAVDQEFIDRLEKETDLLRKLQTEVDAAIKRAEKKINDMKNGATKTEVFGRVPPKQ